MNPNLHLSESEHRAQPSQTRACGRLCCEIRAVYNHALERQSKVPEKAPRPAHKCAHHVSEDIVVGGHRLPVRRLEILQFAQKGDGGNGGNRFLERRSPLHWPAGKRSESTPRSLRNNFPKQVWGTVDTSAGQTRRSLAKFGQVGSKIDQIWSTTSKMCPIVGQIRPNSSPNWPTSRRASEPGCSTRSPLK